jgi:SAM-dependent methyltransferase
MAEVPWADGRPSPALVNWLNAVAPSLIRCGARVAVVGCGLGDDVRELVQRGYDVTGFDISETAIAWARERHPSCADAFHVADLFDVPPRWRRRFDLVVEINTVESLPIDRRDDTLPAIADLVGQRGRLLVIAHGAPTPQTAADGPPWALTSNELLAHAEHAGLKPETAPVLFDDDGVPSVLRMRAVFVHDVAPPRSATTTA